MPKYKQLYDIISIHSPHARGDPTIDDDSISLYISIHSPHARGDYLYSWGIEPTEISIHSPHARGDTIWSAFAAVASDFNPLPSREGRRY